MRVEPRMNSRLTSCTHVDIFLPSYIIIKIYKTIINCSIDFYPTEMLTSGFSFKLLLLLADEVVEY